jgi:hypothetical protein
MVRFDLRQQDVVERALRRHALLARPGALHRRVVAVGEEGVGIAGQNGFEDVRTVVAIGEECATQRLETRKPRPDRGQVLRIRRADGGILKQAHGPD